MALPFIAGCVRDGTNPAGGLTVSLVATPTTKATESNVPVIGRVTDLRRARDFYFVVKGLSQPGMADLAYQANVNTATASVYLPGFISALIRGLHGTAQTHTIEAYAPGVVAAPVTTPGMPPDATHFAVVTDETKTTYVVFVDHQNGQTVQVTWLGHPTASVVTLTGDGYVAVTDTTFGPFSTLADLGANHPLVAQEVQKLQAISTAASVP